MESKYTHDDLVYDIDTLIFACRELIDLDYWPGEEKSTFSKEDGRYLKEMGITL